MKDFLNDALLQNHPIRLVRDFLDREETFETAKQYERMRFVGYVLDIGYDTVTIITSDPFKVAVGGVPRNSFLVMTPSNSERLPPHFTLLRVLESAPTPLTKEVQQTYFELQKRSMPELDVFTQSELQWGALKTGILGMFYPHPEKDNSVEFSGDLNNYVSAHKYRVYAPDDDLLDLIVNSLVSTATSFPIGFLRLTESRMVLPGQALSQVPVHVSTQDFMGARTAMFGKTRLGKSNVVKLIAQSVIETTANVGQLIFDINGEYSNDNPQDDNRSLASAYPEQCVVYALTAKEATPSRPLKLNFYEQPDSCHQILGRLLAEDGRNSGYIASFASVELPVLDEVNRLPATQDGFREKRRATRQLLIYWATLYKAGFPVDERRLYNAAPSVPNIHRFSPGFRQSLRDAAYQHANRSETPAHPTNLEELQSELEIINRFRRDNPDHLELRSTSGNQTFDPDDVALLNFFDPKPGWSGPSLIQSYRIYHHQQAGDFVQEILEFLDDGKTIILDLGNANEQIVKYFSDLLSVRIFNHQVTKFSNNRLSNHYIQLYFEEAHNLFPRTEDVTSIYARFAKEGAKYHIGMVYSTQSPTTINRDLLAQTENFFIAHLSSEDDVNALARVNIAYQSMKDDILRAKTPGYIRMLTQSHRFVVSVQAHRFSLAQ